MVDRPLEIAARFCGPDGTGNGGYTAGLVGAALDVPAAQALEVTLRRPAPLERALALAGAADGPQPARLLAGDDVVAEARAVAPEALDFVIPPAPDFVEAEAASAHFLWHVGHGFPNCFVCGTARAPGDGLRIFAGRRDPAAPAAAPWVPHASVAVGGRVPREIVWAALDCPGYFGVAGPGTRPALLGRMTAALSHDGGEVAVGEPCVVIGWSLGGAGRKLHAGTALFGADGRLVGRSRQVWITI